MSVSALITPILIIALLLYCAKKKVNAYNGFVDGAKEAIPLAVSILPFLVAIFVAIELFKVSGLTNLLSTCLSPVFNLLGIPTELCERVLIRPFSGSGGLAIMEDIMNTYGADSYIARAGSVIMGSSETVFYVATVYFAKTKASRLLYAIPVALLACLMGAIVACLITKIM